MRPLSRPCGAIVGLRTAVFRPFRRGADKVVRIEPAPCRPPGATAFALALGLPSQSAPMHFPRSLARLAPVVLCLPAAAQVVPYAGPDFTVALNANATLTGVLNNRSPLDWWTADGNHATENAIVMYSQ